MAPSAISMFNRPMNDSTMRILFLDQSGKMGGAELSLLDLAKDHRETSRVALFQDGPFRKALEAAQIPVTVLSDSAPIDVGRDSTVWEALQETGTLFKLVKRAADLGQDYDVLYANTLKALVVGALASVLGQKPLIYHLRDILSQEHFSPSNLRVAIFLSNRLTRHVIANSEATRQAFIKAGGRSDKISVIYNGFQPEDYQRPVEEIAALRSQLGLAGDDYVVGHFSRLSPWKGQHILIEALAHCPKNTVVLLVGEALFGEGDYVEQIKQQVEQMGLGDRVKFLGFRSDVPSLMAACDLVTHTSTAPEPFGRVIIEAMLCGTPVIAAAAGGATELVESGKTGWLTPPGDMTALADQINWCHSHPEVTEQVESIALSMASKQFHLRTTQANIEQMLKTQLA
jgi:glycosyltransferase involved in cell wall biosynthesis